MQINNKKIETFKSSQTQSFYEISRFWMNQILLVFLSKASVK